MAYLKTPTVVDTPSLAIETPSNPLFGYSGARTAPASTVRSSRSSQASGTQSTIRHRVLLHDQRCFVTGTLSIQLEACHLVNAIRMNAGNRAQKEPQKKQIVCVLSLLIRKSLTEISRLGTHPHPTTVWIRGLFLGQPAELHS